MYVPHTDAERQAMLERIGLDRADQLFDLIPAPLRLGGPLDVPRGLTEVELTRLMTGLAAKNQSGSTHASFLGGGCYDHFVPAVVDVVASRPEFYTAYTPYQAEVSQGTLQAGFEFQTLIARLTGLDVANASLYEAGTACAEAAGLAVAATGRTRRIVVSETVHPEYRAVLATQLANMPTEVVVCPATAGVTDESALAGLLDEGTAAFICQSPNFFGLVEAVERMAALARGKGALAVQAFDPISLGVLKPPGELGADVAVGEGQGLGTPVSYGGPFLGLFACRKEFVRKMPGRVVGETVDRRGNKAYVLTLQTREQHIRREKATSNICTNQGLLALRASVYLALVGPQGLGEVAELCRQKAAYAARTLAAVPGVSLKFPGPFFKEFVIELPEPATTFLKPLADRGFHAGVPLSRWWPHLERCLLVAVTEKRTKADIDGLADAFRAVL